MDLLERLALAVPGADTRGAAVSGPRLPGPAASTGATCGSVPAGALVFTSAARGAAFFGEPDHDAATIAEHLPSAAVAGAFCSGELAPVGGRNAAHSSSAVVVLLG